MREFVDLKTINHPHPGVIEEHGYLIRDRKHLFYASYLPRGGAGRGIILVSPFGEEKVRTLRIYVSLSRALALLGMSVLYFDYYGDGDSEGDFADASFGDRLEDIKAAGDYLRGKTGMQKVGLLGLRWGATLAALVSREMAPEFLILWEPIIDTDRYFFDHLRSNIASQMILEGKVVKNREALVEELEAGGSISVEGYTIDGGFFVEARKNGLLGKSFAYDGKTLIIQISRNTEKIRHELSELKNAFGSAELAAVSKEFEWEKTETWNPAPAELFNSTFDFLVRNGFLQAGTEPA